MLFIFINLCSDNLLHKDILNANQVSSQNIYVNVVYQLLSLVLFAFSSLRLGYDHC